MDEKKKKKGETQSEQVVSEEPIKVQSEIDQLKEQLEKANALADEYKDKWMRNVAEFDNYKKRNANQWSEAFNEGISSVIIKILPVGDNLDWAMTLGLDEKTTEGLKNVKRKFDETLKGLEIEAIDPQGQPFDPQIAEAVMQVEGEEGDVPDTVKQVFQKGYRRKDKIIRYATVSVVK